MEAIREAYANFTQTVSVQSVLAVYFIAVSLIAFLSMGRDKHKAEQHLFRTPESVLFIEAAIGGVIGSILGMVLFHHKTRKLNFRIGMPLILVLWLLLILLFLAASSEITFL